jgi:hypothetical protein
VRRFLEELCPEQHYVITEDLFDGADNLRQSAQIVNQSAVKMPIKREPLFRGKYLMAGAVDGCESTSFKAALIGAARSAV